MGNLGGSEILVILLVALIVLGPDKLPDAARQAGKLMHQFRRLSTDFRTEFESAILDADDDPSALPGSEPFRDRDDADTLAIEAAARAKGDALAGGSDSPATSHLNPDDPDNPDKPDNPDQPEDVVPTASPASMAYRPQPQQNPAAPQPDVVADDASPESPEDAQT